MEHIRLDVKIISFIFQLYYDKLPEKFLIKQFPGQFCCFLQDNVIFCKTYCYWVISLLYYKYGGAIWLQNLQRVQLIHWKKKNNYCTIKRTLYICLHNVDRKNCNNIVSSVYKHRNGKCGYQFYILGFFKLLRSRTGGYHAKISQSAICCR